MYPPAATPRRRYRTVTLSLFTTLTDAVAYPPQRLLELYGLRWQVELNFRTIKSTMGLAQLEVKSADLAQKEFYAGLMAYNLVRGLMGMAARQADCAPGALSFSEARTNLTATLSILWLSWLPARARWEQWQRLVEEVSRARLPHRKKTDLPNHEHSATHPKSSPSCAPREHMRASTSGKFMRKVSGIGLATCAASLVVPAPPITNRRLAHSLPLACPQSAAFTPLHLTQSSARKNLPTPSAIRPLMRPEGCATSRSAPFTALHHSPTQRVRYFESLTKEAESSARAARWRGPSQANIRNVLERIDHSHQSGKPGQN